MVELIDSAKQIAERINDNKVAACDIGKTLIKAEESSNAYINQALGMTPQQDRDLYEKYTENKVLEYHLLHKMEREKVFEELEPNISDYAEAVQHLLDQREILKGADKFIEELHENNYTTVAVSSAPPVVSMPYGEKLDIDFIYNWKSIEFDENGEFERVFLNPEAQEGKQQVVEALQNQGAKVMYIGNGGNDLKAAKQADASLIQRSWEKNPEKSYSEARKVA